MAKVGLAAELARQAAKAAREEVAAADGVVSPKGAAGWVVPRLAQDFRLDAALRDAFGNAERTLNRQLEPEGLVIDVQQVVEEIGLERSEARVSVLESGTDRLVRAYDGLALLRLYTVQRQAAGVVVDGQV